MPFVLDASIPACWAFPDENHGHADLVFTRIRTEEALVPSLWWFEARNILVVNERRKRISEADTASFLRALSSLGILVDHSPDEGAVLSLARKHRLSIYDAAYLELAQREVVPLATLDAGLIGAPRTERVTIIGEK